MEIIQAYCESDHDSEKDSDNESNNETDCQLQTALNLILSHTHTDSDLENINTGTDCGSTGTDCGSDYESDNENNAIDDLFLSLQRPLTLADGECPLADDVVLGVAPLADDVVLGVAPLADNVLARGVAPLADDVLGVAPLADGVPARGVAPLADDVVLGVAPLVDGVSARGVAPLTDEDQDLYDMATLIENVALAREELFAICPNKVTQYKDDDDNTKRRCRAFPYAASKGILTELRQHGYEAWIGLTVKKSGSVVVEQTGQFIAYCRVKLKNIIDR